MNVMIFNTSKSLERNNQVYTRIIIVIGIQIDKLIALIIDKVIFYSVIALRFFRYFTVFLDILINVDDGVTLTFSIANRKDQITMKGFSCQANINAKQSITLNVNLLQ